MPHKPPQPQPATHCSHTFCPVPIRILWPVKAIRVEAIAAVMRVTAAVIWRRSELLGVYDQRPRRRVVRVSRTAFAALWADRSLTLTQIGESLGGLHPVNVGHLGRKLGLPPRVGGQKPRLAFGPEFNAMWLAGVAASAMARFYGCAQPTISKEARRRGHDLRVQYPGRPVLTLAQFQETEFARRLAASAKETAGAMRDAEMIDAPTGAQMLAGRREKVRAMRAEGKTLAQMQAVLKVSLYTLQNDIRELNLVGTSGYEAARQRRAA